MFGGRGGISGTENEETQVRQRLETEFRVLFPAWREVGFDYFWSGLVCLCRDLVLHLGQLPGRQNAWYGLAFHGGGVSMASWSGAALAEMITGSYDKRYKVPAPMLKPLPAMPIPALRPWYLRSAYAWYGAKERLLGRQLVTNRNINIRHSPDLQAKTRHD
jgi:glycine/D-amino acid oxidase-like deaminating enzyme